MKLKSKIVNKYPTYRDVPVKNNKIWLAGRREDDNAEGLWRIHDKLYDLSDFIDVHPGGRDWLRMTKGTDITEAFETHHIQNSAEKLLPKFYTRDASQPRNCKLTFHPDGFYRTLKNRVAKRLPVENQKVLVDRSKLYCDFMLVSTTLSLILTSRHFNVATALLFTSCLILLTVICHNFLHQGDNWRMYLINLTSQSYRDWRVFHALSHHLYPNSLLDLECSLYEPFFNFLPTKKNFIQRFLSWIYLPIVYASVYPVNIVRQLALQLKSFSMHLDELICYILPVVMYICGNVGILETIFRWLCLMTLSSFIYGIIVVTGGSGGHHNLEVFHDGDELKSLDFGIYQLAATIERAELRKDHFGVITTFGQHVAHHFFPTLDHGLLLHINDIIYDTCKEFEVELTVYPWYKLMIGQYKQLSRVKPHEVEK